MMLRHVGRAWLNPDQVIGVWVSKERAYQDTPEQWVAVLRCAEGQVWNWKFATEAEAYAKADEVAAAVNGAPSPLPVVVPSVVNLPPTGFGGTRPETDLR